ncbi:hypothetical protein L1276_003874 [Flavobacterium sp. HSC-32F16]|uniref:hypothetical protein n=1 Tax=Flavobacterium sp. HSC-32F16 TaxID=2910964 RepID=UPI0020A45BC1|nr:hypothetical protein [Flavobacterium sp. HSC-32F16]MCP2028703.1 hypothetical protein [Flavobacterium sp. HSC-32F16]
MLFGLFKSLDEKVKEDKENLIARLNNSELKTLVIEMGNNKPISNDIIKRQKRDQSFESKDFLSWYAYRIFDELSDINLKPKLIELLKDKDFFQYKQYVLGCLSSLCVNCKDYEIFDFRTQKKQMKKK